MNVAVILRAIPDPDLARGVTGATVRLDDPSAAALALAMHVRALTPGATLTALAAGPEEWDIVLREALALDVDIVQRAWSAEMAGTDAVGTAKALAGLVPAGTQFVVSGSPATDHGSGILPAVLAELLGWPLLSDVAGIAKDEGSGEPLAQVRAGGGRRRVYRLTAPMVITAAKQPPPPLYPRLRKRLAARRAEVPVAAAASTNGQGITIVSMGPAWPRRRQLIQPSATANPAQRLRQLMSGGMGGGQSSNVDATHAAETLATWLIDHHFVVPPEEVEQT